MHTMVAVKTLFIICALGVQAWAANLGETDVSCSTKLDTVSLAPNQIPTSTATVVNKITVIKKVVRKVNVVVVPRAKTTTIRATSVVLTTKVADPRVETATSIITCKNLQVCIQDIYMAINPYISHSRNYRLQHPNKHFCYHER